MTSRLRWVCCHGCTIRRRAGGLVFPTRRSTGTRACTVRYATRRRRSPRAACCRRLPADELSQSRSSVRVSCSRTRLTPVQQPASATSCAVLAVSRVAQIFEQLAIRVHSIAHVLVTIMNDDHHVFLTTHPRSGVVYNFGPVCMYVCLSVYMSLRR